MSLLYSTPSSGWPFHSVKVRFLQWFLTKALRNSDHLCLSPGFPFLTPSTLSRWTSPELHDCAGHAVASGPFHLTFSLFQLQCSRTCMVSSFTYFSSLRSCCLLSETTHLWLPHRKPTSTTLLNLGFFYCLADVSNIRCSTYMPYILSVLHYTV